MVNFLVSPRLRDPAVEPRSAQSIHARPLKRVADTLIAIVLLVLLSPVLLVIAILVRSTTPGGSLFRQTRVGRGEKPFTIYKFRTMDVGCSDEVHKRYVRDLLSGQRTDGDELFKLADDPRVTRVGAWLRRTSLDELPQLINVARGDMALIEMCIRDRPTAGRPPRQGVASRQHAWRNQRIILRKVDAYPLRQVRATRSTPPSATIHQ